METIKKLSLDDIFGKVSASASSEAVKSIDDIFGQKEKVAPEAPYGTMTDEIRGVSHAPADLIGVSPQPAIIGENELQKNRAGFEKELKSTAGAIQPTQDSFKPISADAFKVGGDVTMPGDIDKPKTLSQTVQSEINKRWGGDLQSIIDKARSVSPDNIDLAEDMESHFWKVMKDKVPSDSFITQEDLDGFKFTHDYSNGDKDIEYSFGHYTYPQEVVNEYVARHNDEVLHNMRFKEEPEYRNEWFLRNVGVTEQAYRDEVAADLENRLQELRKKVVATLPAQHTRGGYAAIGAAANKPSSGASVSIEKIDKALKTVNTLRKNSFGAGLKEGFDLADILTLGVSGIGENVALLNALNKSVSGKTLTTSEQALVEAWDIQNEAEEVMQVLGGRSLASNIGRGGAQSLGFITQTVGTGGLASAATKGITRAAAKSALKRVASTGVASKIQEGVRYGSLKAAESLVGAAARTPFMGFTYRNYTDKRLNQFQVNERVDEATGEISKYIDKQESSALRDAAHAALESYFESQSEDVGGLIDFGITSFARALPIKQFIRSSVVNGMTGAVKNGAMKWIKESAKIYGLAGEVLSEAYDDAAVNLLTSNTDGWKQMASSEYWWELLGVSSMLSGGFGVVNRAVNSYSGRNLDRQIAHEDNNRRNALSRIEDDMLKKELTEISLTDDLIERSKMLSSPDWSNFTKEDMANTIDFISAQTRLDVMRESDMESRRLARIMPAIDEVKKLADSGALDDEQAAANLATIYSDLFRTQENQRALNILTDRIKVAADAGISADKINDILRGAGLTVFNPGDEIETLTGDRAIIDKVLPGAYEVVNNEGDRAVVSFEEVLQNTPEVRQIQQESNQTEGQTESAPENNPQVEQAVADARAQVAEIINKDDSTVYEVETDDDITGYIIGGKGIVVDSDGRIKQSAEDTVVVKTDEGNRVVHKERVKIKNRQTLQEIEDLARGAAEGALAAVQPQQPVGGKTYQGIYDNEQVTITLPREIKFNEDGTVDYDNLMNPETVSVIRPNGAVVDEVGLNEIEQLTEVQPEAEQVSADVPAVEQQEATNLEPDFSAIRPVSIGDFGPIYDQFRGNAKDAIALLLQRKDGEAVGALSHPEVGEIDLVWGHEGTSKSDGYGLSKLAKYHPEVLENLQEILNDMKVASRTENRVQLESDTHKASVRLTWNEQKKNWLLTAFEKKEASASIGKTTDTDDNPKDLRGDTALSQNADALSDNKDTTFEPKNQEVAQKNVTEAAPVVQQPQIPLLKNGEPDYNAMDARMFAEQYVTRFGEGATERIARNNIKASNKTISTIEKQIEDVTDPNKMPALYSKLQDAQATKDKYSAVLEELGLSAYESEDNAARIQRKKQENTPWFNKLFPDGFPNVESVILWDIANGNRIRWTNKEVNGAVVSKGLGSHLGLADSNAERTRRVALIGKDAPTPEEYAEQLPERLNAMGIRFEESELLDTVIAVYTSVDTVRKAKEELEKISANIQAEQEGLDYEEEQMRRNYEREQEVLRKEAQADVVDEQTEQEQPTNEETQEEELSIEDEVPFMISGNPLASETTEAVMSSAKNEFEETDDWSLTGWLLPDGTQLSFSEEGGYERDIDHRAIGLAYAGSVDERWKYLQDFEQRGGIRVSMNYGSSSIELSVKPTSAQFSKLSSFIRESGGNVDIDFMDENYNTSHSASYDSVNSSRVLSDIERYFDEGIKPSGNVSFEIAEARRKNKNEAQLLATEAAITALEDAGVEVVNATPEMVEEALQRKDVQMQAVNQKFNEQLDSFTEENANAVIFDLGMPSPMLIAGGVPNKPIRLYGSKLLKKIRKHGFSAAELSGLPMALANPIAVFNNYQREGNRSVLIELSTADGNSLVSIDIGAGSDIDFDIVKSVFGKDGDGILNWINKGYLTTVDKEKALAYLRISAPIAEASNKQELDSATKIVENFENPKIEPDNSFSIGSAPVFVSNAKIAVLGIKQEKATPEQWLKMIEKAGGLKAGEDKWIGLSDWLKASDKKTLTKQEMLEYINENQIQIEETTYSSNSAVETTPKFKTLQEEFKQLVKSYEDKAQRNLDEYEAKLEKKYNFTDVFDTTVLNSDESKAHSSLSRAVGEAYNAAWVDLVDQYGDDFEIAFWRGHDGIRVDNAEAAGILLGLPIDRPIYHLREDFTTKGLEGNREIALTVPTIEPWNENDEVHFGDAGGGRAIAWVRFGETTDEDGKRVLVIDEIQSKRHQEGREKGYISGDIKAGRVAAKKRLREAYDAAQEYRETLKEKYNWDGIEANSFSEHVQKFTALLTPEEIAERERLDEEKRKADEEWDKYDRVTGAVPEAPFEKNWAELAMKRMLRYAAENGFDKVAWTKGDQQAERYNIGSVVDKIVSYTEDGAKTVRIYLTNNEPLNLKVDSEGKILYSNRLTVSAGQNLSDVVGKDVAVKILRGDGEDATIYAGKGKEYAAKQLSGDNLRIGGEGMRAFYDQMLPSFMRKYGKKWGATVQDVTLPYVEEAGRTMHSVDVTDSMRESVMQGQPMFYRRPNGTVYGWTNGTTVYLTESGMNPNTPIHEYTHIWADAMRKHNPEGWKSIVKLLKGTPVWNEVMADTNYANIHSSENQVASEALSRISGRENSAKMEAMAQQMIDENANDTVKKNRARKLLDRMRKALQEFWSWVGKELFGIKNFESIDQVTDRILYDLVSGTDLAATPLLAGQVKAVIDEYDNADEVFTINDVAARISEVVNNYTGTESTTELENILEDFEEAKNSAGRYGYRMDSGGEDAFEEALRSYAAKAPIGGFSIQPQERAEIIRAAKANDTYLKAPNGKDTNLTPEQWVTVRTKAFKRWFGDWENSSESSQILDANGEPLVVWHGGQFAINAFKPRGAMHFGTKKAALERILDQAIGYDELEIVKNADGTFGWKYTDLYGGDGSGDASSTRAFTTETEAVENAVNVLVKDIAVRPYFLNIRNLEATDDAGSSWDDVLDMSQDDGHDGIVYENWYEDKGSKSYIAFSPNQIKLADGSNTTFDPDNDDIRFSIERDNESEDDFSIVEYKVTPLARLEEERDALLENRENNPNFEQEYAAIEERIREERETDRVALTIVDGLESEAHRVAVEDAVFDYVREHNLFASQVYVVNSYEAFEEKLMEQFAGDDLEDLDEHTGAIYKDGIIVIRADAVNSRIRAYDRLIHEYTHALTMDQLYDPKYYRVMLGIAKQVGAEYMVERLYPNYEKLGIEKSDDGLVAGLMELVARDMEFVVRNGRFEKFLATESSDESVLREYFDRYNVPKPLTNLLIEIANKIKANKYEQINGERNYSHQRLLSATSLEDAGANLQPDAGVDGEGGLQFRGSLLQSREGVTADAGGQVGGRSGTDRADLAESNQTAKSESRARLIAELRQKLRDVKAETRTVAAEVGKIVRKAITAELIDKMGKRTFDNIVRTIETATVRRDVEYAVNRIEEAVLDMELRDKQDKFDKYLNLRVQGESARGVSIAANVTDRVRQFITIIRDNLDRPASEVEALIEERGGSLAERTGLQVLGFYQDARNFEREVQEIEDEIEKIKSENTELRKKRAALNKAGKTNDAKNLSDQINANKETIEHLNSERISTKRSQLYYIDMAANELEREIAYGKEGHKEWLQQEAERKQELIEIAWNDIGDGKDIPILDEQEPIWKKTKNAVVDFLLAPAYSWDYLLKMISVNAPNGEGALYDHFMRSENGYVAASGNYYQAYEDFKARLNEKAKDIFGKDYKQVLKDSNQPLDVTIQISAQYAKLQSTTDENKIREGASEIYAPTIGEAVYAYMAAKMPDGRVRLDKMGVKEDKIDYLVRQIPQGYITFADWVQNEFLPERRKVYNKTHLEVFGTQMAQIENYVPLKVKKDFVYEEFDGSKIDKAELPSSITGSIIKRKRNSLPIDLHTNIFDLLLDHGQQMEHWNAYTRIVRDTNQFLSNTQIRRALDYRKKGLHRKLKEAALIASNRYQPDVDRLEKMTVALSKMAASSKIAFRINTAIKQVLSYPAFYAYVADVLFWRYLTRNLSPDTWGRNFRWALDNIPSFQERWLGRMAGDDRLAQMTSPQLDRWIKGMGNVGMLPNALVDAVTCANGAQAVYRYEHERYLKIGLDEPEADRLAKIAAAQALNQTQQSSEGMYLSRIQADRTAFAVLVSTFQNSNFAYLRKELEGIDQLMRDTKKQIANREKYYEQHGVNPDQAAKLSLQDVASANRTAVVKILVFGFILSTIWTLGNSVWKYAFGDDDEEDKWEDAAIRGFFNSFTRNLSVGQYVETVAWSDFRELNPSLLLSDLNMFIERLESIAEGNVEMWDRTAAWTVLSTLSSLGLGVDINSFASMCEGVQGAIDNGANVEDIMLLVNAPRSQAKFIAGPPKEGETLDEYTKRQAWIERKIVSRIDKKQLDKWSRNYEAYKQAEMLGVSYSRDKMGRVSVPYIKDIDDSYSALLKSVGRTKSGAKRNDGDSIADDVKTRIRDFGLIKRIKDINALEKNLDAMVILDGAYPERLKELCEAKQQLIEEWNQ